MSWDSSDSPSPNQRLDRIWSTKTGGSDSSSGSAKSRRKQQVVVFIRSEEDILLKDSTEVHQADCPPLAKQPLSRSWKGNQKIYLPGPRNHGEYAGTVELDTLSRFFKLRRLTGAVKELYIFENPLRETAPAA